MMDRWMDRLINQCMDGWIDTWMDGWIDTWMDAWMDRSMHGLTDRWMAGYMYVCVLCEIHILNSINFFSVALSMHTK